MQYGPVALIQRRTLEIGQVVFEVARIHFVAVDPPDEYYYPKVAQAAISAPAVGKHAPKVAAAAEIVNKFAVPKVVSQSA